MAHIVILARTAAVLAVAITLMAAPAQAQVTGESKPPDLNVVLLDNSDVPVGFELTVDIAGSQRSLAQQLGMPSSAVPSRGADYLARIRRWQDPGTGRVIFDLVTDFGRGQVAAGALRERAQSYDRRAVERFEVPGLADARGYVLPPPDTEPDRAGGVILVVVLRQGRLMFQVGGWLDSTEDVGLVQALARQQAAKAPPGLTEAAPIREPWKFGGELVGATASAVATYLAGVWILAWLRDPLRRRPRPRLGPSPPGLAMGRVIDVTKTAMSWRGIAVTRLALQLAGLWVAAPAFVPFLWPDAGGYAVAGVLIGVIAPRIFARAPRVRRRVWVGARRRQRLVIAGVLSVMAAALFAGAVGLLFASALSSADPVQPEDLGLEPGLTPEVLRTVEFVMGIGLLAAGSGVTVLARRLAAARARALMQQDPRKPLLYLRSFGDDHLKLRMAIYGPLGLLQRLSPRRFARFEQVIARHLAIAGPVVAVNRPGTRLAPLGAARESLPDDRWQEEVDDWMRRASWIVVSAAPEQVPPGLEWELDQITKRTLWERTLLVLPPITDAELRARWARFAEVLATRAPARGPLPLDPAAVLVCRMSAEGVWTALGAVRRDEWSYAAALDAVLQPDPVEPPTGATGGLVGVPGSSS